jgi:hypothetical protein
MRMLVALVSGKLDAEFARPPAEIEDFLTSVVLGSCRYLDPQVAFLPFLAEARDSAQRRLAELLPPASVKTVAYEFWPDWFSDLKSSEKMEGAEPELVARIETTDGRQLWLVVEAKLLSGKSSGPSPSGPVADQLGKYWLHLLQRAMAVGAEPLGIVYLTRATTLPHADFEETQDELRRKQPDAAPAPLFWASWRHFIRATTKSDPPPLLVDMHRALREFWRLEEVVMEPWPAASWRDIAPLLHWRFKDMCHWPRPLTFLVERKCLPWQFTSSVRWPSLRLRGKWHFKER